MKITKDKYIASMNDCPYAPLSTEAGRAHFAILNYELPNCAISAEEIEPGCDLLIYADSSALISFTNGGADESFASVHDARDEIEQRFTAK